ncbi:hypothetical protein K432DRAFT_324846 [Lepidopterella palustris CBS 459.81]|uniref:UBA domain-containing protein n=1 Tax=Lepidopterella palustris CBS 459.81 TaxID=1314670 RepID=A0A8E2EDV4_9PEZI|nr:hypothetical protein K432DRAFT_324846 [Lepidopterella palustris CBS 459.81]
MEDLSGLNWTSTSKNTSNSPSPIYSVRQTPSAPLSGRSTPLSAQLSGSVQSNVPSLKSASKPSTPANDSFSGLLSLNSSKATNNLSLQERQKQLLEEKARQDIERKKQYESQFGAHDAQVWDSLGNGRTTPASTARTPPAINNYAPGAHNLSKTINRPFAGLDTLSNRPPPSSMTEDDVLTAFNSDAPVDASSHFPAPKSAYSSRSTPSLSANASARHTPLPKYAANDSFGDDDDPFGLGQLPQRIAMTQAPPAENDDDDILGMLGKPVSEFLQPKAPILDVKPMRAEQNDQPTPPAIDPRDQAIAELVDMGFPADKSAFALEQTDSGTDVQAAVGWLLNQAHNEATQKTRSGRDRGRQNPLDLNELQEKNDSRHSAGGSRSSAPLPAWMRAEDGRSHSTQRKQDSQSPAKEKDVSQYASEIGSTLFKSANTLWKTGQKKVQKAVADFQQEGDSNQPKWMRNSRIQDEAEDLPSRDKGISRDHDMDTRRKVTQPLPSVTDEAMMLESGLSRPQKSNRQKSSNSTTPELPVHRPRHDPGPGDFTVPRQPQPQPRFLQQQAQQADRRPAAKLTRQDIEEQTAQAYVSPARRKRPNTKTETAPLQSETPSASSSRQPAPPQSNNPFLQKPSPSVSRMPSSSPIPTRPKPPPRRIPPVSSSALSSSATYRQKGTEAFKRGDYPAAHTAYSAALAPLPDTHPITIIVLCNRALTNIKVGDPKAAVSDADSALNAIGVSRGEGEKISLGGMEGEKDMNEFYGKALMRKAEALEHMEKWTDAAKVWKEAVEAGVGGFISIQGRNRCEKAVSGGNKQPASVAPKRTPPIQKPLPKMTSPLADLTGPSHSASGFEAEAVKRLREANAAAEQADDEKFALTDQVDAKLVAWKGSRTDNLRALLGSLDTVLWPEAGWNKVSMSDLVMPNKVKIVYMKAIAKVHPDKISQTATTEQRMISGAVFSTLNEAWDKFKQDNGM